jgi:hypothetical protein
LNLDWANERYVRSWTRDTARWLELSLEAQGLYGLIRRKLDRAGVLDFDGMGRRAVAVLLSHPHRWKEMEPSLLELERGGWFLITEDKLFDPTFLESEEAATSNKERQRAWRERRAAKARFDADRDLQSRLKAVIPEDQATQEVRNGPLRERDVSLRNRNGARRDVTPTGSSSSPFERQEEELLSVARSVAEAERPVPTAQEITHVDRRVGQSGLPLGPVGVVPVPPLQDTPPPPAVAPEPSQEAEEAFTPEDALKAKVAWDASEDVRLDLYGPKPGRIERPPDGRVSECLRCFGAHEGRPEWIRQTARRWNLEDPTNFAKRRNPRGSSSVFFAPAKADGELTQWESFQRAEELEPVRPAPANLGGDPASREAWGRVLEALRQDGKHYALSWLERMVPLEIAGDELRLLVPDRYFGAWVEDHYRALLDGACELATSGLHVHLVEGDARASA